MKTHLVVLTFSSLAIQIANSQLLSLLVDALNPVYDFFSDSNYHDRKIESNNGQNGQFPGGVDPGTPVPQATGFDELFPADCGRHPHDGTGKLCFPDGLLCQQSKLVLKNMVLGGTF